MSKKVKVRTRMNNVVINDLVSKKGEIYEIEPEAAERLVAAGLATHAACKARVLRHCIIANVIYSGGEEIELSESDAKFRHNKGDVEVLHPGSLNDPTGLSSPVPPPKKPARRDPYEGQPLVPVKAKRAFLAGS